MNPVFEVFCALVVWADKTGTARVAPDALLGANAGRIMGKAQRIVPEEAAYLCSGLFELMLFRDDRWESSIERMLALPTADWRDALLPPDAAPAAVLKAVTSPQGASEMLALWGRDAAARWGALYSSFLANPKTLRRDLISVLSDVWRSGFRQWMPNTLDAIRRQKYGIVQPTNDATTGGITTLPALIVERGEVCVPYKHGTLRLVAYQEAEPEPLPFYPKVEPVAVSEPKTVCSADVAVFKALGDATRLRMLQIVARQKSYPTELAKALDVSAPTVSHHLAVLRTAGLISVRRHRGFAELEIDTSALVRTLQNLGQLLEGGKV